MVLPNGWRAIPTVHNIQVEGLGEKMIEFTLWIPCGIQVRRQPIAVEVTLGDRPLGQIAEALVTANWPEKTAWGGGVWE